MYELHHHYDQLTAQEREFVDLLCREAFRISAPRLVQLAGDDRAERAADALARWVLESRPVAA